MALMGVLALEKSNRVIERREKSLLYSGHFVLLQRQMAAHALCFSQKLDLRCPINFSIFFLTDGNLFGIPKSSKSYNTLTGSFGYKQK
jgi:hypothetical protein